MQPNDTCGIIVDKFNNSFTAPDLYRWNPYVLVHCIDLRTILLIINTSEIGTSCFGLIAYKPVCISVSPYTYPGRIVAGTIFTADQTPVPRQPDIVSECTKFEYTNNEGHPSLANLLRENGLSKVQWNKWNWKNNDSSLDLFSWAGHFSCIGV